MKGIAGIIYAIVLIVTLILTVVTITYLMNLSYEQQQTMETYVNKFVSSPKAFQINTTALVSNGPLKKVRYPNGQVKNLSQPFEGSTDLSSLLISNPVPQTGPTNRAYVYVYNITYTI